MTRILVNLNLPSSPGHHAALAYFYDHREAFDVALAASLESSRVKAAATMDSPLRMRLDKVPLKP